MTVLDKDISKVRKRITKSYLSTIILRVMYPCASYLYSFRPARLYHISAVDAEKKNFKRSWNLIGFRDTGYKAIIDFLQNHHRI